MNAKPLVRLLTYLRLFQDGLRFSFPLAVVFLVIALVWGRPAADDLFSGEIFRNVLLNYPVYADLDSQNNLYVIDNASRRIVCLSTDGQERWQVTGGKRSGGFYETYRLAAIPDGGVLAYNYIRNPDDSLQAEEIVKFTSGGAFAGVLVHVDYDQSKAPSDDQHIGVDHQQRRGRTPSHGSRATMVRSSSPRRADQSGRSVRSAQSPRAWRNLPRRSCGCCC